MSRGDYYFSQGILKGLGNVFFLKVLQAAPPGSPPRRLVGSFVDEVDYGLFGIKRAPGVDHSWDPEYFLTSARALPGWSARELVLQTDLAGATSSYKIETKAGVEAKGAFPGAPVSAGLEVDYHRLNQATVTLGPGSKKLYVPENFVPAAYKKFAADRAKYDDILFDADSMLVTQIVLATNLKVEIQSQTAFDAQFDAKAGQLNNLGGGINYHRTGDRSYALSVSDGKEYLFAIGAVEADKFAGR